MTALMIETILLSTGALALLLTTMRSLAPLSAAASLEDYDVLEEAELVAQRHFNRLEDPMNGGDDRGMSR